MDGKMNYGMRRRLLWVWKITNKHRTKIVFYILLGVLSAAFSLGFVYATKYAVDTAVGVTDGNLVEACCWIVVMVVLGNGMDLASSWLCEVTKAKMNIDVQRSLTDTQMMVTWEASKNWHTGDLLVRIREDAAELVLMLGQTLPAFCVTCIKLAASVAFLWLVDPMPAILVLVISPLVFFSKLYYKKIKRLNEEVKRAESKLGVVMQETLRQRLLVRALSVVGIRRLHLVNAQAELYELKLKQLFFATTSQLILRAVLNGGYLVVFIWGVYRLHHAEISFGTLAAFLQLVSRIQSPILSAIAFVPAVVRNMAVTDRLMELQDIDKEADDLPLKLECAARVAIEDISFKYGDREVLNKVRAFINPEEPVALIGATGKGKTTLIRLLLGLIVPQKGTIWLETTQKIRVSAATRINFSYVPQGNSLFSGTVRENLLMVKPGATEEEIKEALLLACATFVYALPQGIDTLLGESGYGLSEGQAQRIAVARALLQNGKIWLFDEVTSALDTSTADNLIKNILKAGKAKTLIFVTHDYRLMEACKQHIRIE